MKTFTFLPYFLFLVSIIPIFSQTNDVQLEYNIKLLDINSNASEMGVTFFGKNKVYFASNKTDARSPKKLLKSINTTYESPSYDMYEAVVNLDGTFSNVEKINRSFGVNGNESNPTFTSDLKYVYYTQNNIKNGRYVVDKSGNVNMKIYRATVNKNGDWENSVELPFNSNDYSCAHPSLSEDDKVLFFTSNMSNFQTSSDIYWVLIYDNGSYGKPMRLSDKVNSSYKDNFPFIKDNFLYFSSDRPGGNGGLDLYRVNLSEENAIPENLGLPINSKQDDFGIVVERKMDQGYFTSNRSGGKGEDDIYFFKQVENQKPCVQKLWGIVFDSVSRKPIVGAKLELYSSFQTEKRPYFSEKKGEYHYEMNCFSEWQIEVKADGYINKKISVPFSKYVFKQEVNIYMEPIEYAIDEVSVDKSSLTIMRNNKEVLNLPHVFFNLDEASLTLEGKKTVEKAVDILLQHPELYIEFGCHTDTRASFSYNVNLSDQRVNEVLRYMLVLGADPNRISGKGYGETQPVNKCVDGVFCTEAEHQENRRAEFVIIKK